MARILLADDDDDMVEICTRLLPRRGHTLSVARNAADAVLSVPGIDMVQFGASDFSMSIGLTGQANHPDVVAAEKKTIDDQLKEQLNAALTEFGAQFVSAAAAKA